jgi:hypothetical protein
MEEPVEDHTFQNVGFWNVQVPKFWRNMLSPLSGVEEGSRIFFPNIGTDESHCMVPHI